MQIQEHKFLADFQPIGFRNNAFLIIVVNTTLNFAALFGVAYVIGLGLRLGLGL